MSWKASFSKGITSFQAGRLEDALIQFNEAIKNNGENQYPIYDSRAAVYEKLNRGKDALRDAKKTIDLAPDRWQGYSRSARIFLKARKFDACVKMADMSLQRIKPDNVKRREEMEGLKEEAGKAMRAAEEQKRRMQNHMAKLPVEIFMEVFRILVEEDSRALIQLLHVCQYWRYIAWNIPALWETLALVRRRPAEKAKLWIDRSHGRIKDIHVGSGVLESHDGWETHLTRIKWDGVQACTVYKWDLEKFLKSINQTHMLSNIRFLDIEDEIGNTIDRTKLLVEDSKIQHLCLIYAHGYGSMALENLRHLTYLEIRKYAPPYTSFVPVLENNSLLETIILEDVDLVDTPTEPLQLSHLTRFEAIHPAWKEEFMGQMIMPQLQVLRVEGGATWISRGLSSLSTRGLGNLTELILCRCSATSESVIDVLKSAKTLQQIYFSQLYNVSNNVVEALAPEPPRARKGAPSPPPPNPADLLCPVLSYLSILHCPDVRTGSLVRLLRARNPPLPSSPAPLEEDSLTEPETTAAAPPPARILSLTVDGCENIEAEWLPWFRQNVKTFSCIYMSRKVAGYKR
ncbi:hypothetical protein BDQ12DRAFT_734033 [Crucibulum laeve]|uniref:F-box domain-containing protein n=1 Tax=Crucibulum laeve TaxID=68775 RepID=A0A5C3M7M7_9AGAR|nr:hypothetical protein BDQ12DRAFT_734033 [Crucibulum laeve]